MSLFCLVFLYPFKPDFELEPRLPRFPSTYWRASFSIVVQPNTGMCEGFTDSNGERRRRSIVLAPVKIRVDGGDFTLTWTCNLAESYHNKECFYAKSKMAE